MNQQACDSLGYTREELLNLYVRDVEVHNTPNALAEIWDRLDTGKPITVDGVHGRKDDTTFPVEIRLCMFESGQRPLFLALARAWTTSTGAAT